MTLELRVNTTEVVKVRNKGKALYLYSKSDINKHSKHRVLVTQTIIAIKVLMGRRAHMSSILMIAPRNSTRINRLTLGNKAVNTIRSSNHHK